MSLLPRTQFGRYEVRTLLGAGGMGEVYLAQDTTLNRPVAIKLLPANLSNDRERLQRFKREADTASGLNHPNILTIYEIGTEAGLHFIATEFVDGESLRQRVESTPIQLADALDIIIQVASALSAAHAAGVIHRDIKPDNIMIRRDGIVKVLDFGLAKLVENKKHGSDAEAATQVFTQTEVGVVLGTVPFMSPEQARGLSVDERTDIWSLGVVLYELVAGRLPFAGETTSDVIASILKTEPPILNRYMPDVPGELERIVAKTLRKDREERYQMVKDVALDLKSLKQRLSFETELERTEPRKENERNSHGMVGSGNTTIAMPEVATGTDPATGVHAISLPGYMGNKNIRHRIVQLGVPALLAVGLAIAAVTYFVYSNRGNRIDRANIDSKVAIRSIAVLPFDNVNHNPDMEYLSDGISESLINNLSQLPQLKIIARSSSFKYKGKDPNLETVAKALGVEAIVTGRVTQRGENLVINVELTDARDGTQVWGEQYNRQAVDLLQLQAEISKEISERLRLRLTVVEQQQLAKRETVNPQAYEQLLKGHFLWRKGGTDNQRKAIEYYQEAIGLDPNYSLAYAELSAGYSNLVGNSVLDPKEFTAKAEVALLKALALDEKLADAHLALANFKLNAWDWAAADREYRRAVELNPNLAEAYRWYSVYLTIQRQHKQAIAAITRAKELDPLSLPVTADVGWTLLNAREYDEAIAAVKKTLALDKDYARAHSYLGYIYAAKGMYADAIAAYLESIRLDGPSTSVDIYLGSAYAGSGERQKARAVLKRLQNTEEYVSPGELAILYGSLGNWDQAFASLEQAYAAHDLQLQYLGVDPAFDPLRSDPRFGNLMHRVGLPPG